MDRAWSTRAHAPAELALALLWSRSEPARVGEVLFANGPASESLGFGRACAEGTRALSLVRQRPGDNASTGPTAAPGISRHQWCVRRAGRAIELENTGRRALRVNGADVDRATLKPGDLIEIADEALFLAVLRPPRMIACPLPSELVPAFGEPDAFGIVGESAAIWELRRQLAFGAGRADHVLLTGESGTGKELAARAIHAMSRRAHEKMIARNAATFPEGLVDAELFGNLRDYPNPGMPERSGLIGAADGSTLFLDEIGELPHALQAHLLRVLEGGEYQRLGESRARRSDVRIVAATNRAPDELKHDLLARLRLRVAMPGLGERREDVPLLARHLLRKMAANDPLVADRVLDGKGEPRMTARFVAALVQARYRTHVRELEAWLWQAILDSDGVLDVPPAACLESVEPDDDDDGDGPGIDPKTIDAERVRAALADHDGSRERAWRALGLRSRHQLLRLMRRYGL
ncbi:MAG TPA: sigma 54-interacting transcriptional regulator [Kofleriaceae bacterium]|nr:sigma 54-interacting transcriptional regulator [Kofleriaceae bacterium]